MIEFKSHFSSSKGNLYTINDGNTKLLIECGVPLKDIKKAEGFNIAHGIRACLVSHEH